MGDHYLPQYYLKGFSENDGKRIWVYDKEENRNYPTQVKSTANETGFYRPDVEEYLANTIENPANLVLDKIRSRGRITKEDKEILSNYMVAMLKRVPQSRELLKTRAPIVADQVFQELSEILSTAASDRKIGGEFIERRRVEVRETLDSFADNPSKEIWLGNIPPETTPRVTSAFRTMTWTFLTFDEKPAFLTCDDPVFFFRGLGIGKPEAEVVFPISSNVMLWLTWRTDLSEDYFVTSSQIVKEMNRRIASNALRYLYHPIDEHWILPFARKNPFELHLLNLHPR